MKLELGEWRRLWNAIGAHGDADAQFAILLARYSETSRHYHTAEHIAECLREFRNVERTVEYPNGIEMAIWMHDVIYDPRKGDNEERSANFAAEMLRTAGVSEQFITDTSGLIMVTRHSFIPNDDAACIVVDIDLSILGQAPERFWRYEEDVRKEYAFVPEETFRTKRAEILEGFLQRERIYQTKFFANQYETRARENLRESIRRLRS